MYYVCVTKIESISMQAPLYMLVWYCRLADSIYIHAQCLIKALMGLLAGYALPIPSYNSFHHLVNWQIPSNWMLLFFLLGSHHISSYATVDAYTHTQRCIRTQNGPEKHSLENTFPHYIVVVPTVDGILCCADIFARQKKQQKKNTTSWSNSHISSFVSCSGLHWKWFPSVNVYQQMLATSFS